MYLKVSVFKAFKSRDLAMAQPSLTYATRVAIGIWVTQRELLRILCQHGNHEPDDEQIVQIMSTRIRQSFDVATEADRLTGDQLARTDLTQDEEREPRIKVQVCIP